MWSGVLETCGMVEVQWGSKFKAEEGKGESYIVKTLDKLFRLTVARPDFTKFDKV